MSLGIGRDRDFEIGDGFDAAHEMRRGRIAERIWHETGSDAAGRIAAQRDNVANADIPVIPDDLIDFVLRRRDAGEMRGRLHMRLAGNARDNVMGAFAGRAAGAIGDGDKMWLQRLQTLHRLPELRLHFRRFRRKEFVGNPEAVAGSGRMQGVEHQAVS